MYFRRDQDQDVEPIAADFEFEGRRVPWVSYPGVFQSRGLDPGTALLLRTTRELPGRRILDLGCGHGPLGLLAVEARPGARAWLVDVNPRAVRAAEQNRRRRRQAALVLRSDGAGAFGPGSFDLILTNPPIRIGLPALRQLFTGAGRALAPGGTLAMVTRPKQGGRRLVEIAAEILGTSWEKLGRKKGYETFALTRH